MLNRNINEILLIATVTEIYSYILQNKYPQRVSTLKNDQTVAVDQP